MGIPKFFRWVSERYPLCSQLITETRIPEFDNLYLDMNGIIHHCSHPNDADAHFRVSEEKIFIGIFNYIDHLFTKIKPKKLFFMAIDGVAPRAKMNQQRARRFKTAKDAADAIKKAQSRGEELPDAAPFDSNCITPGTEFMKRLSCQLEYFINKKVSEDANWRDIEIVLSGHDVPGEGEHKIMEYIRTTKAQPDYNPNVRHCLYGLDADLIMLGLISHDPHFALLREEVTFGPTRKKKSGRIEAQNFYLMHLSILREYLDLEFSALRDSLPFEYNLERIIDDFILLALFVGNDFIPHLPNLHIAEGALGLMYKVYKKILPQTGGYINDGGILDIKRLELVFNELVDFEKNVYEEDDVDQKWIKGKQRNIAQKLEKEKKNKILVMTQKQHDVFNKIKEFVVSNSQEALHFPADFTARDRDFIHELAKELVIRHAVQYHDDDGGKHVYVELNSDEESDDELKEMRTQVIAKYEQAEVVVEDDLETIEEREKRKFDEKLLEWKREYYKSKMEIDFENSEMMDHVVGSYVEGLQWVLHYYYNGVASWGWFYPYHYSPKISDLHDLDRFDIKFELGVPFRPFEQLLGVLPEGSKKLLPDPLQWLMTDPSSPIIDFYPKDFELDPNGKKQDWEAVIRIPFIDQKRLIVGMKLIEDKLTPEEKERNSYGESAMFIYDPDIDTTYNSPLSGVFPSIRCHCRMEPFHLPTLDGLKLVKGLCDGVQLGVQAMAGFPSLDTISHKGSIEFHGVNVFNSESKNETMVITLINEYENMKSEDIAEQKIGKRIFVGWPFLQEGFVRAISDELFRYEIDQSKGTRQIVKNPHRPEFVEQWRRKADKLERDYSKRQGTITGKVDCVVHASMLKGLKRLENGALVKEYMTEGNEIDYAVQTTVDNVEFEDARFEEKPAIPISEEFPSKTQVFFLGESVYGSPAQVIATTHLSAIHTVMPVDQEPAFGKEIVQDFAKRVKYFPSFVVSKRLSISGLTLSKLTASLHVIVKVTEQRSNLGLNLKFEAKKQKVLGYTRKSKDGWEYTDKAIQLLQEYKRKFPEFIQGLENMHKDDIYHAEDFYDKEVAADKINEIKDWLKSVEVRDFERVSLEAEQLDKTAIEQIEQAADELIRKRPKFRKIIIKNIPPRALLKPSHATTRLQDQKFYLGDRVIFVQDSGNVPIAAKGTVVGIERNNIDVVFDVSFMSGSTLGDRCSQYRGMTVPGSALLNLTTPQYLDGKHSSSRTDNTQRSQPNGYHWQPPSHQRGQYQHNHNGVPRGSSRGAYPAAGNNSQNVRHILARRGNGYAGPQGYSRSSFVGISNSHTQVTLTESSLNPNYSHHSRPKTSFPNGNYVNGPPPNNTYSYRNHPNVQRGTLNVHSIRSRGHYGSGGGGGSMSHRTGRGRAGVNT